MCAALSEIAGKEHQGGPRYVGRRTHFGKDRVFSFFRRSGVMAASRKKKPVSNRPPVTGTPSETLTPTEVVRGLRLCYLYKWANFKGYGFEVKADKKGQGFVIAKVDIQSPADMGGLRNDDRIIEVNGTSVNGKTYQDVLGHINEDPTKVQLLVIDNETDQEFARRHEVPSRKSPRLVHKAAPAEMPRPTTAREHKSGGTHKAPAPPSDKVIAIEELSSGSTPPVEVGKLGKKAKPVKPKLAAKGGGTAKAAEVSKAEAELLQKFVRARVAESTEADLGKAEDDTDLEPADPSVPPEDTKPPPSLERRGINAFSANTTSAFPSTPPYSSPELGYYGGFADDAPTDSAGYYWTDDQYPWAPPSSPMYAPQFSGPSSPPYAQSPAYPMSPYGALSPMSGAGGYAPYAVPGSPYWPPPMMTPMVSYQAPYGPLMPMPSAYGYPYVLPSYPDFSFYSAPYPSYPPFRYAGGPDPSDVQAEEGGAAHAAPHQAGSAHPGRRREAKPRKEKAQEKAKAKGTASPAPQGHKPDQGP
ncbi:uncharacterized protein [Dermacentor andersoni]|uniref:uncharacterized protein n=1 Tax=Dermacentor andersoni TaxID=34620 RepID=UPI003B3A2241